MRLDGMIGNGKVVAALKGMVSSGRIPHSMMFYENDGCGAMDIVNAFLCDVFADERKVAGIIHPDVHYVYPIANGSKVKEETKNLRAELFLSYWRSLLTSNPFFLEDEVYSAFGIEGKKVEINNAEAREVIGTVYLTPVEGGWKAVVIYLPERMNTSAANRLLKAIEEPPEKTLFIMVTHAPEKVMQTIASRCQSFRVLPCSKEEVRDILASRYGKSPEEASRAALVAGGSVGNAVRFLSDNEGRREQFETFRSLMEACSSKDLTAALQVGEALAALSSRERQKAFCSFAGECLRKVFMVQQKLPQISGILEEEEEFFNSMAARCRKSFPRMALPCFDRAGMLVDRNVNQKILFCDLVGKIYLMF